MFGEKRLMLIRFASAFGHLCPGLNAGIVQILLHI